MSKLVPSYAAIACLVAFPGCALLDPPPPRTASGTVTAVFSEPLSGILVDRSLAARRNDGPTWVEVRLSRPLDDGSTTLQARIDDPAIAVGATVHIALPAPGSPVAGDRFADAGTLPGGVRVATPAVPEPVTVARAETRPDALEVVVDLP